MNLSTIVIAPHAEGFIKVACEDDPRLSSGNDLWAESRSAPNIVTIFGRKGEGSFVHEVIVSADNRRWKNAFFHGQSSIVHHLFYTAFPSYFFASAIALLTFTNGSRIRPMMKKNIKERMAMRKLPNI